MKPRTVTLGSDPDHPTIRVYKAVAAAIKDLDAEFVASGKNSLPAPDIIVGLANFVASHLLLNVSLRHRDEVNERSAAYPDAAYSGPPPKALYDEALNAYSAIFSEVFKGRVADELDHRAVGNFMAAVLSKGGNA